MCYYYARIVDFRCLWRGRDDRCVTSMLINCTNVTNDSGKTSVNCISKFSSTCTYLKNQVKTVSSTFTCFCGFNYGWLQSKRHHFCSSDAWQEFGSSAYFFSSHVTDRDSAQRCCQREGAHLTSITSAQELTFIMDQ